MAERLEFDPPPTAAPAGERKLEFDEAPKSGGAYAAKELPREMELRAELLKTRLDQDGDPGYRARFKDNFTWGLGRPVSGLASVVGGEVGEWFGGKPATAGERWRAGVGAEEDYIKQAERNTPGALGVATDVAGGLFSAGPRLGLVKAASAAVPVAKAGLAGKALVSGAGSGAIEGAARNAESPENALVGAGVGGVTGGVAGKAAGLAGKAASPVVNALTDRFNVQAAKKAVTEATERAGGSEPLKEAGGAIYKKLDDAGISFSARETPKLATATAQKMVDEGFNKQLHKELVPALEQIGNLKGKPATWTELQNIRTQLSDAKASDDKRVRRMAGHLTDVLDDFVDTAKPTIPVGKLGTVSPGDPAKARDLWRRGSQAENAEWLTKKGMATSKDPGRKLETNFGGELDKINNPNRFSTHQRSPEQAALIEKIAVGDPNRAKLAQFLKQQSGKLVGLGALGTAAGAGGLYAGDTTGIGSGVGTGGAATLGLGLLGKAGAGKLSRGVAKRGGERANALIRDIVTGSAKKAATQNVPREALAKLLAAEQLKRGASRYAASKYNKE